MNKYKIIAICGKSAAGKDTLLQGMLEYLEEAHEIISHTTRPPREGEVNGKNYHFVTDDEFIHKLWHKEMLETAKYNNWWYGTAIDSLSQDKVNIGVFNRKGLDSLMSHKDVDPFIVYVGASDKTRLLRALKREEDPDVAEIVRRYLADEAEWSGFCEQHFIISNEGQGVDPKRVSEVSEHILEEAKQHWANQAN